jgi:hypothetical protein
MSSGYRLDRKEPFGSAGALALCRALTFTAERDHSESDTKD